MFIKLCPFSILVHDGGASQAIPNYANISSRMTRYKNSQKTDDSFNHHNIPRISTQHNCEL